MKTSVLLPFVALSLATAPLALAQTTVKTKVKPAGQASVKTKASVAAPPAQAVPAGPTPSEASVDARANALTDNMKSNLGLTPQQTEKVRVINRRGVEMVETARLRYRTDPRKLAGIIETAGHSRLSALKDVLTPAQFDKYQRKREEKMGIPGGAAGQGTPPPGMGGQGE